MVLWVKILVVFLLMVACVWLNRIIYSLAGTYCEEVDLPIEYQKIFLLTTIVIELLVALIVMIILYWFK